MTDHEAPDPSDDYASALGRLMIIAADLERALADYCVRLDVDEGKDKVAAQLVVDGQSGTRLVQALRERGQTVVADYYKAVAQDRNHLVHGAVWFIGSRAGGADVVKTNRAVEVKTAGSQGGGPKRYERVEPTVETWTAAHINALADDCVRLRIRVDHSMRRPTSDGEFYFPESHMHSWSRPFDLPDPRAALPDLDSANIPGWPPEGLEGDELDWVQPEE